MADDINVIAEKLVNCISSIMNPQVDHATRQEAYKVCEEFKEGSPLCPQCGLLLSAKGKPPIIRHFGLQLIEHCIKFRWNDLSPAEKLFIKDNGMDLLTRGTDSVLAEPPYIKDALSRIFVEIIKREWPQQWPSLLQELDKLCSMGETQTELVLLIFLRLAEDIVTFQNVQNQRRKEIYQMMSSNLKNIFAFFLRTLNDQYTKYNQQKQMATEINKQQMLLHEQMCEAVLKTLAGFVEWVPPTHIVADDGLLQKVLCILLANDKLQMSAAECLLLISGRKGTLEDRRPILQLFEEEIMTQILSAASSAEYLKLDEQNYLFLKKLCQLLTNMGLQLASLLGLAAGVKIPETFAVYLTSILSFTRHPSHVLSSYTPSVWSNFCQNAGISSSQTFRLLLPEIGKSVIEKLIKEGFPSKNDSPSCNYSCMDFDSDEAFMLFYNRLRVDVVEVIKQIMSLQPEICLKLAEQWLNKLLQETNLSTQNSSATNISTLQTQWDGLEFLIEGVVGCLFSGEKAQSYIENGTRLLELILSLETQDPVILSSILSCITSFFAMLNWDATPVTKILDKLFSVVVFSPPGQTKSNRTKQMKNVRRHSCSSIIRLCKQHAQKVLPAFDRMYNHIKMICQDPEQLSLMEKGALYEALILLSNEFCNYEKQYNFLLEIISPISEVFHDQKLQMALSSGAAFVSYVGLDREPSAMNLDDVCGENRSVLRNWVIFLLSLIKRSAWPSDDNLAKKGGFLLSQNVDSSEQYYRNPAAPHVFKQLNGIFLLLRVLNSLFSAEAKALIHPDFAPVLERMEREKFLLSGTLIQRVGIGNSWDTQDEKSPVDRMKIFLFTMHENCFHLLGCAAQSFGFEFYAVPELPHLIETNAFAYIDCLSDFRFRFFNRAFIKNFLQYCPTPYNHVALSILEILCPFMYQKLSVRWEKFKQIYGTSTGFEDQMTEIEEIVADQLNRQITREYMEILGIVFTPKRVSFCNSDAMDEEMEHRPQYVDSVSELGKLALKKDSLRPVIVITVFNCIHWLDATAGVKSSLLCPLVLKQLMRDSLITQEAEAAYLLRCILLGLQEHGEHEFNQSTLVNTALLLYESVRPHFPSFKESFLEMTGCKDDDVKKFDDMLAQIASATPPTVSEKRKKEAFKKLLSEVIGKNVGQHYKREIKIKNLPPLFLPPRPKKQSLDEVENNDIGLCSLFTHKSTDDCVSITAATVDSV